MRGARLYRVLVTHEAMVYANDARAAEAAALDDLNRGRSVLTTDACEIEREEAESLDDAELDTLPIVAEDVLNPSALTDRSVRDWASAPSRLLP